MKARPVTAPERYAEVRASALGPFVYRRYLDYGVFESLREMKALIEREVERRELAGHIKLGPGGIREIEFIVQAFQLIRGGRERRLQTTLAAAGAGHCSASCSSCRPRRWRSCARRICTCGGWRTACRCSPTARCTSFPPMSFRRSASRSPWASAGWGALLAELGRHQACVSGHFNRFVFGGAPRGGTAVRIDLGRLWDDGAESAVLAESLAPCRLRGARPGGADAAGAARLGAGAQAR